MAQNLTGGLRGAGPHGRTVEEQMKDRLMEEDEYDVEEIENRGLTAHEDYKFIAGAPDGILTSVGIQYLLECKYTEKKTPHFLTYNNRNEIDGVNPADEYYYQVIGLLEIFNLDVCWFAVQIKGESEMRLFYIHRNTKFFNEDMLPQLHRFYFGAMLPNIVRPLPGRVRHDIKEKYVARFAWVLER